MNPEAQDSFLAQESTQKLNAIMGDGLHDFLLNGGLGDGVGGDPMKALLVSSLLKHPKTQVAGTLPKIVTGDNYNDMTLGGAIKWNDTDPDVASMVKRSVKRGKFNLNYHINTPAMQERLAMLQSKHDIVLITGGFEYDKLPYLAQQTLRNLNEYEYGTGDRVLVLVNDKSTIEYLQARSGENIKYLTHLDALDLELKDKLSSSFGTIILGDIQVRSIAVDLWLYLIKSGRQEGRKYLLVSNGLYNKPIVDYLGSQIGLIKIDRTDKDLVRIYYDYVLTARDRTVIGNSADFWNAIFGRINLALKKIYMEGYRNRDGNVVVFLPNSRSIRECFRFLQQSLGDLVSQMIIYQEGDRDLRDQSDKILVYLTTEIPSVVPRVGHVIDSGLKIIRKFDPESRIHSWKLTYLDEIKAKEREALASVSVFKLYELSSMEPSEQVEILRSPSVSKYLIKLLGDRRVNGKRALQQIMTRYLITPISRDRFLDFWEPLEDMGLIKNGSRQDSAVLTFLAKDCFSPLDLDLELCAVLLTGRKIIQDLELLAQVVAILNIGGSIQGNWIYDRNLLAQYQDPKADIFGLVRLIRSGVNTNLVNEQNIEKVQKMSHRILNKLRSLDEMCLIIPNERIVGDTDQDKIIHILRLVYGEKHLVVNGKLGEGRFAKDIKLKQGLVSTQGRRYLALELKELSEFKDRRGTLYGNMVVDLN